MTQDPRIGAQIAGFKVVSLLGRGGMGVVYLAQHPRLGRRVALKVLAPEFAAAEELRWRFVDRESRHAARIEHPNVLPIYDAGEEADGTLWIAMRYVDGKDLGRILREQGSLAQERTMHLLEQVAEALDAAHAQGLIHRDVKPENIMVEGSPPREHAYLTDFGLTRHAASGRFTAAGGFLGSVHYASPEVIEGRTDLDRRSDVYSLGCVLFQCLTGRVPFDQAADISVLYLHVKADPPKPSAVRSELPETLDEVIRTALAKRPEDRYPTCGDLIEAALAAIEGPSERTLVLPAGRRGAFADRTDVSAQLIPIESRGRRSTRHRIRLENRGSTLVPVGLEPDERTPATVSVAPRSLDLSPRSVAWAGVRVRLPRGRSLGRRRVPFDVVVRPQGIEPITLRGAVVRPAPVRMLMVILPLLLAVGAVWALWPREPQRHPRVIAPTRPVPTKPRTCPLTGALPPAGGNPDSPALAVKVDNYPAARKSQSGLFKADIVYEEPIEGGRTRFVAVFQCSFPDSVGPVRGPRPTDPDLLTQLGRPLFAFGNDKLAGPLDLSRVVEVGELVEPNGYRRAPPAIAPYNLVAIPQTLLATAISPPPPNQPFRYADAPPSGAPKRSEIHVPFEDLVWRYEGPGDYVRYYGDEPHTSEGRRLQAANVIIQYVRITQVEIAGEAWVKASTMGRGQALVFRDGVVIPGMWTRRSRSRPAVFEDAHGKQIELAPGITWIELVPATP
jgi:serine/threonine protein kinase